MDERLSTQGQIPGYWLNGQFLPIIAGGDENSTTQQVIDAVSADEGTGAGDGNVEGQASEEVTQQDGSQESNESPEDSLANDFLSQIPEEHREVVAPYVKKWDAGVTRRFQDIHSRYAPYKELGEVETLQKAQQVYELLTTQPEVLYELLADELGKIQEPDASTQAQQAQQSQPGQLPELPPQYQEKFNQMEKLLTTLAQHTLTEQQQVAQSQEDQQLEQYMGLLKEEFGEFDETFVLTRMLNGVEGPDAVKEFMQMKNSLLEQAQPQQQQPSTPILSGGGAVPNEEVRMGDVPSKDVTQLVAGLLQQAE